MGNIKRKSINFGEIDHFLYVRINCLCADLGLSFQQFIEEGYVQIVTFIDEEGITHFEMLRDEWENYAAFRSQTRFAPRMKDIKHAMNVNGIHEEVYAHLRVIKEENNFTWVSLLQSLLLVVEYYLDKEDQQLLQDGLQQEQAKKLQDKFRGTDVVMREDVQAIDKTRLRRQYENRRLGGVPPLPED